MNIFNYSKSNGYKWIFAYSLVFLLIRLFVSQYGMTYDEAEQFLDTQYFVWGYSDQPPLYTWILQVLSLPFGLSVTLMIFVYHTIVFFFLIYLYKLCDLLLDNNKQKLFCFLSYILFFIYSYDFYRYTIHTALMVFICTLSLYQYIKIYKNYDKQILVLDYLKLGLYFGLGILSKYNFLFFILAIIFSSLFSTNSRKILFNYRTVLAIALCLFIISPHVYWIFENDFQPLNYALKRGASGYEHENFALWSVLLNTYWNYLVYFAVITILFLRDFDFKKDNLSKFLLAALVFCIIFPFCLIIFLKAGNFSQRWLAPLNLFVPISCFYFIYPKDLAWRDKLFKIITVVLIIIFYSLRCVSYYFQNDTDPSSLARPNKQIFLNLKKDLLSHGVDALNKGFKVYAFKEVGIYAAIKIFNKDLDINILYPNADINLSNDLVVFSEENKQNFMRFVENNKLQYALIFSKSAPYFHSSGKLMYKVNFAIVR